MAMRSHGGLTDVNTLRLPVRCEATAVFAGGGVRGIALAGAAAGALLAGYRFPRVIGTSAGAMVGALVAAGYHAGELSTGVRRVPWAELADPARGAGLPIVGRHAGVVAGGAVYRGDRLEEIWAELLARKGVRVFGDLEPGSFKVVATDVTHQRGVVLPDDLVDYDLDPAAFPVAKAVRISSAVPFVFRPVELRSPRSGHRALLVDGALASNFPLRLTDPAEQSIVGFRLVPVPGEHVHVPVRGPISLTRAVVGAAIRAADTLPSPLLDRATVIEVPAAGDPLDFAVAGEHCDTLFEAGRAAFRRQLIDPASKATAVL
jgi:NTE family protein